MKTFNWGEVRKEQGCHDRGHQFKRVFETGDYVYQCKCGATAIAYKHHLKITRRQW